MGPRPADRLLCAGVLIASGLLLVLSARGRTGEVVVSAALLPASAIPLLWRRTHPGAALVVLAAAFIAAGFFGRPAPHGIGVLFGVYAAALYGERRVRLVGGVVAGAVLISAFAAVIVTDHARAFGHLTGIAFGYGVAWVYGERTRVRRAYLAELEARARQLERERDEHAVRAADAERNRIARELHDVVAHNVSVIAVQAGAARTTAVNHPERATEVLAVIERTARGTLTELRAQLGVLRRGENTVPARHPQPGLAQLEELIAEAGESGLQVRFRIDGRPQPLSAAIDLCAYRIVQEALTNAVKHAPGARVNILLQYTEGQLRIVVVDDGPGPPATETGGHGLIGMRERVELAGGQVSTGPALGGGFRIEARLPAADRSQRESV